MNRLTAAFILTLFFSSIASAEIASPEATFGFRMGEDKKLIDWNQIHSYFRTVDQHSDRIIVEELGKSTLGKPFLLAIISSESNMKNLERQKTIQRQLAKPYDLNPTEASKLVDEGKTVVLMTLNIHSTEIASSQEAVELLYEFATSDSPQIQNILNNVIVLLIPSLNPDGQQIVVDWYRKTLGTPAEGSEPPELYHPYAGHDNNRDWFMYNLVESRNTAKVLYSEWFPEIVYDQHQMGSEGPRLFMPPYADPVNPNVHPLVTAQVNLLGKYVVADLQRQKFQGVVTGSVFNAYFEGTMSKTPLWHNRIGILSEMASAHIATPIYYPRGSISGHGMDLPENKTQTNFLDPWEGGWWRLRDIVNYEKAATYSLLEFAANFKAQIKNNFYNLNKETIQQGRERAPYGYVIPIDQYDPNAATDLVNRFIISGIEVTELTNGAEFKGRKIPAGSYHISTVQPGRSYIKDLLEIQRYPNLKLYPGGPPQQPYDVTAWTLPMQMDVEVIELDQPVTIASTPVDQAGTKTTVESSGKYLVMERRYSNSYGMVHALMKQNVRVFETRKQGTFAAGLFVIRAEEADHANLEALSRKWQVPVKAAEDVSVPLQEISKAKIGIYQPYTESEDEGWTRYVLDQFQVEYKSLHNQDFKKKNANLRANYDVILLPSISATMIVDGKEEPPKEQNDKDKDKEEEPIVGTPQLPKEFQGGIGKEGIQALKEFVNQGGTLLALGKACDFAIEKLRLPATNELKDVPDKDFYAPGSIFEVDVDTSLPLAYGMRKRASIYFTNNPALRLFPYTKQSNIIASYGEDSPLLSGFLLGEERLFGKTAMAEIPVEKGRVILYGFRVQHRAQTRGTFRLLLNALFK